MKYLITVILMVVAILLIASRCSNPSSEEPAKGFAQDHDINKANNSSQTSRSPNSGHPLKKAQRAFRPDLTEEEVIALCYNKAKLTKNCLDLLASSFDGEYPSEDTLKKLKGFPHNDFTPYSRNTSNWFLQQCITMKLVEGDHLFYTPMPWGGERLPDGDEILEQGECGFSYVQNLTQTDYSQAPVLMTPMINGTLKFDKDALFGKAVVLFLDSSVRIFDVKSDGTLDGDGAGLFEMSEGRDWGADPIGSDQIAYPLAR